MESYYYFLLNLNSNKLVMYLLLIDFDYFLITSKITSHSHIPRQLLIYIYYSIMKYSLEENNLPKVAKLLHLHCFTRDSIIDRTLSSNTSVSSTYFLSKTHSIYS
jgi:hypothetical protein